jgi:hypothetical protein
MWLRVKVNVMFTLEQAMKAQKGSTFSLTSELDGVGGHRHASAILPPGDTRYPLYRRLGGGRVVLDGCGKFRPNRDSIPGPLSP